MLARIAREAVEAVDCAKKGKPHPRQMTMDRMVDRYLDKLAGENVTPMTFTLDDSEQPNDKAHND